MAPRSTAPRVHLPTLQDAPPPGPKTGFRSAHRTLAPAYIDEALGPDGHLARLLPGYESRPGQLAMSRAIDKAITDGKHLLVEAPCGCHARGQGILLRDGSVKEVQDVVVGDRLIGPDGESRDVLALHKGRQEMVDVVPIKGSKWRVNLDHVLTLVRLGERRPGQRKDALGGRVVDVSVREYMTWSRTQRYLHKLFHVPADFDPRPAPLLTPYFVGIMLGDGTLAGVGSVAITKPDEEILAATKAEAARFNLSVRSEGIHHFVGGGKNRFEPNAILTELRRLKIKPIACEDRFVPDEYKLGSREVRLGVLAGLIDTDGTMAFGCFDFLSKSKRLAADVVFIARSLGLYARGTEKFCRGFGVEGVYYRVQIAGNTDMVPCRIPRKKARPREQIKNPLRTGFDLVPTGVEEDFYGFEVSGDGRYLLDDFTVTHNSGKGVGYLVPAIHHAVGAGKKVVVATANINLQEQLIGKDLPMLRAALPTPFSFGLAKGRSNYLCVEAFEEAEHAGVRDPRWSQIREWVATTTKGDVSELPFEPGPLRAKFTVSSDDCMGRACPSFERCFAEAAKREYQAADVVVTNYHLLLLDMMIKLGDPESGPLPPWAILVGDEIHQLPDISRGILGFRVTKGAVDNVARLLAAQNDDVIDADLASDLRADGADYFEGLKVHARSREYKVRLREKEETHAGPLATGLNTAGERLTAAAEFAEGKRRVRLRKAGERASVLSHQLLCADELIAADRRVYCIEVEERGDRESAALCSKLIFPADVLRPRLFDVPGRVVVGTSATLAVDRSFDFVAHELGAESARELAVPTPFDFERQALLVVPRGMPDPKRRDEHEAWCADVMVEVAAMARGRTLCLFTSRRGMRKAAENFTSPRYLDRNGIAKTWGTVLVQGDAPRGQLVARFKAEVGSVLLGLDSFWEGVDVPGEALSVVVIDRLPFATPDDPVLDAVDATLPGGAFKTWSLPRAVTAIRQGQGRLIRAKTDRGVVVILDDRIVNAGYGQAFLRSLPPMRLSRRLEDVAAFLGAFPADERGKI